VGRRVVRLIESAYLGQRNTRTGIVPGILGQVIGIRLAPVTATTGGSGSAADRASIILSTIGLHIPGRTPGISIQLRDAIIFGLLGHPDLAPAVSQCPIRWSGIRVAWAVRFDCPARI